MQIYKNPDMQIHDRILYESVVMFTFAYKINPNTDWPVPYKRSDISLEPAINLDFWLHRSMDEKFSSPESIGYYELLRR